MMYCPKCQTLGADICDACHRKGRAPQDTDSVLLVTVDRLHAQMIEPLLEEAMIPFSRVGNLSAAMSMMGGMLLESLRFYVPFGAYHRAHVLIENVFSQDELVMGGLQSDIDEPV